MVAVSRKLLASGRRIGAGLDLKCRLRLASRSLSSAKIDASVSSALDLWLNDSLPPVVVASHMQTSLVVAHRAADHPDSIRITW